MFVPAKKKKKTNNGAKELTLVSCLDNHQLEDLRIS